MGERMNWPASSLVKITIGGRSCSVVAAGLLKMLSELPESAGSASIEAALEVRAGRAEAWAIV